MAKEPWAAADSSADALAILTSTSAGPFRPATVTEDSRAGAISPASVGLSKAERKALHAVLQEQIVAQQIQQHVASIKHCPWCGKTLKTKGHYQSTLRSVFGRVAMLVLRPRACPCSESQAKSFSKLFTNKSPITPELRYLTAKMAALPPFRKAADFLGEQSVVPFAQATCFKRHSQTWEFALTSEAGIDKPALVRMATNLGSLWSES